MFRAITPQHLIDDQGVEVSSAGRNGMRYRDGDRVMMLYCDAIADGHGRFGAAIVLPREPHWQPPFEHEVIDHSMRAIIARNLVEAWDAVGYHVVIEDDSHGS